jgi:amino acid transporter
MIYSRIKRFLIGEPIASHRESHERLSVPTGMAVFASDALSSTAYASEEVLIALTGSVYAAQAGLLSMPVGLAIVALLVIVVMSYRQVIRSFPQGGGTYNVSKSQLGTEAGLVAGAALLIDYVLTAAVSVSAGMSAIISTGVVGTEWKVPLSMLAIALIMVVNLRGVRESGRLFTLPIYLFIGSMLSMIIVGFWQVVSQNPETLIKDPQGTAELLDGGWTNVALLMVLMKAFSHGCAALTGIEAVSDGVRAFKEPSAVNANRALVFLATLLGTMFLGVTFLAYEFSIRPAETETVVSQLAASVFGYQSIPYFAVQISTLLILVLGANTAFSDFPRLASFLAHDGYLPRQLVNLGDRLVFSNGITILAALSMLLIWLYQADTHSLIPLYAVGVFLAFTLSQTSLVVRHVRMKEAGWKRALTINAIGAITTGVVTILLAVEKFLEGAWLVLVAIPLLIQLFKAMKSHYVAIGKQLALPESGYCPMPIEHTVLVLVSSLNKGTIPALEYAKTISDRVEALHVELKPDATERLRKAWDAWGCGVPLTILKSPYRSISEPLLNYIDEVESRYEHDLVTIIVPEFVTKKTWHNILHNQSAFLIKALLRLRRGKVVTTVRYYLDE